MKNRKIAALILSVMMVMCSMPSFVFAQENAPAEMQGAPAVAEEAPADEEAAADEAVGSDDAQEKSAKAKDPQETVKEESGEKVKAESIDGTERSCQKAPVDELSFGDPIVDDFDYPADKAVDEEHQVGFYKRIR